jgi:pimeloyl-ACP methyl ester carboxylesterase
MPDALCNGVRIHYEVEGAGPPLLLHIGLFGSLEDWYETGYVAALRDTYRLVLIDPRGQGRSDNPRDSAAYAPDERVRDVIAVLDDLGIGRTHFWGYSLGGRVGYALAASAPNRLASLIVGGADPYPREDGRPDDDPWLKLLREGMAALVADCELHDAEFFASPGERARWLALDAEAMMAACRALFDDPGVADALSTMALPALIYRGTDDSPEPAERSAMAMPEAIFVPLEGLDHAQAINCGDLVLPHVCPFLERVTASDSR